MPYATWRFGLTVLVDAVVHVLVGGAPPGLGGFPGIVVTAWRLVVAAHEESLTGRLERSMGERHCATTYAGTVCVNG